MRSVEASLRNCLDMMYSVSFFLGWRIPNLIAGFLYFLLFWVANTQLNHWTTWIGSTRLITGAHGDGVLAHAVATVGAPTGADQSHEEK